MPKQNLLSDWDSRSRQSGLIEAAPAAVSVPVSAWHEAQRIFSVEEQHERHKQLAASFQGHGWVHQQVALLLWEQRKALADEARGRIVHISAGATLLAVVNLAAREIQLRCQPVTPLSLQATPLQLRILPASAQMLDGDAAPGFERLALMELMWYLGQTRPDALQSLPALGQQRLSMKRFPLVRPSTLLMRQLGLIHILSQDQLTFEQLLFQTDDENKPWLCADLASLHLTRSLHITGL